MDRRDEIAEFGSPLNNLPNVEFDEDSMTATFFVEAEPPPPPPPPPPSKLEQMGAKLDEKLASLADRVTEKLHEKGVFQKLTPLGSVRPTDDYHQWFPLPPNDLTHWSELPTGFRELAKSIVKKRSLYRLFRVRVDMKRHFQWADKERRKNSLLVDFHLFDSTRYFPHVNVWFAANCSGLDYHDYKVRPFQVGIGRTPYVRG